MSRWQLDGYATIIAWARVGVMSLIGTELPISNVRCYGEFRGQSGLIVLILSFVESDP